MGTWTVGHNLTGYLPESDVLAFAEWKDAADYFASMAQDYASEDDQQAADALRDEYASEDDVPEDEWPSMEAFVRAVLKDDGPEAPDFRERDYVMRAEDNRGRMI